MLESTDATIFSNDPIWIWAMLQFLTVFVSLAFILWQINLHRQKNMLDAILNLDARWKSERIYVCREKACENYHREVTKINYEETEILGFFEDLGIFLKSKVFDRNLLWDKYSYYVENYWAMYETHIHGYRKLKNDNTWYERFEYLMNEMERITKKKGLMAGLITEEDINIFRNGEKTRYKQL